MAEEARYQTYDNVIKRLFERHREALIPLLLEERDLAKGENEIRRKVRPVEREWTGVEELNIEALIPPRRNDRVYRSPYKGKMHVVEVEIETSPKGIIAVRSLIYHALSLEKYGPPIISMILYPFKMPMAKSPFQEENGDGEAITFHFRVLPLWKFDARSYFEQRAICMYAFLPAMGGVTKGLLFQALDLMVQYYRNQQDEDKLREELIAFCVMLRRAALLPAADIEEITKKMATYDPFLMEDSHFGGLIHAEAEKARAEGKAEGELKARKDTLLGIIEVRFPTLAANMKDFALPENSEALHSLTLQIAAAPNESSARLLLGLPVD